MSSALNHMAFSKRVLLSLGVLGTLGAVAGLATYATFTSTTSATNQVSTGTVVLNLAASGAANRMSASATNVAAGDTMQRAVDLVNTSSLALASETLTTNATISSALDTDATNGLQLVIDKCSVAWTEAGTAPAYTYTCGGTTSSVLASRAVIGSSIALSNTSLAAGGGTDHLRLTWTLPSASTLQGLSSTINYSFTGTQRAATNS
jgi:predicted ribosomally synthesized peptide with SipW-like signal peptide